MGGFVAFEMAVQLAEAGAEVALLALVDVPVPAPADPPDRAQVLQLFADNLAGVLGRDSVAVDPAVAGLPEAEQLDRLRMQLLAAGLVPDDVGADFLRGRLAVFAANVRAMWRYAPRRPFPGRITSIRAEESAQQADTRSGWAALCGELDDRVVPGGHYSMWAEPNLPVLARTLLQFLPGAAGG